MLWLSGCPLHGLAEEKRYPPVSRLLWCLRTNARNIRGPLQATEHALITLRHDASLSCCRACALSCGLLGGAACARLQHLLTVARLVTYSLLAA